MSKKDKKKKGKKKCKNENDQKKRQRSDAAVSDEGLAKISRFSKVQAQENVPQSQYQGSCAPEYKSTNPVDSCDLAKERKKKKRKRNASDSELLTEATKELKQQKFKSKDDDSNATNDSETDRPLEGRMVPHPKRKGEQIMVLMDCKRLKVFSALKRTDSGDMFCIGNVVSGNVVIDDGVLSEGEESQEGAIDGNDSVTSSFPFLTNPDDHCESPVESYQDIAVFLNKLCKNNRSKEDIAIYDPYYCNGAVVRNLASLGFPNVRNIKEDCYHVWSSGIGYPKFDVLITNPPYSEGHIEKLMQHVTNRNFGDRPWFLLMPDWVHKKDYYKRTIDRSHCQPFYLVPKKRYVYLPPKKYRDKKVSDVHKKTSPFVSMWYIWGGTREVTNQWIHLHHRTVGASQDAPCDLARSRSALRDLRRKGKKR